MVNYKINLIFKDSGESLNEVITKALKKDIQIKTNMVCKNFKGYVSSNYTHYSQDERSMN